MSLSASVPSSVHSPVPAPAPRSAPCFDCPRRCGAVRKEREISGFCRSAYFPHISRAAPHFGEEPCLSGSRGAGTIFFSGCSLGCVYCQNAEISRGPAGRLFDLSGFRALVRQLEESGVHNIELVTPGHHVRFLAEALSGMRLSVPVVWNSSGYESVESLRMLEGLVQIWLPDLKYLNAATAARYSHAPDYPEVASAAIDEMFRQAGPCAFGDDGLLRSGVLIRHLILPGWAEESRDVIDYVADHFPAGSVLFSLMSQYTPMAADPRFPELSRLVTPEENEDLIHYMRVRRLDFGYWQEPGSSGKESIPDFDGSGLDISADLPDNEVSFLS